MRALGFVVAISLAFSHQPSFAETTAPPATTSPEILTSVTMDYMASTLRELGYRADVKDNFLITAMSGYKVGIFFFNCDADRKCLAIEFETFIGKDPKYTIALANTWNSKQRYTKLYIDPQNGTLMFDYDLAVEGITKAAIKDAITRYELALGNLDKMFKN
jgi:hypothetical protein